MPASSPSSRLKHKALQWLSARDYSRAELRGKLQQWLARQTSPAPRPRRGRNHLDGYDATLAFQHAETEETGGEYAEAEGQPQPYPHTDEDGAADSSPLPPHVADSLIEQVLDDMQAKGFLSDTRAALSHIHRRAPRLGKRRLQQELRQRGLDETVIDAALLDMPQSEQERARAVWQRKFAARPDTPREYARQMRFMAARGFDTHTIQHILRHPDGDGDS